MAKSRSGRNTASQSTKPSTIANISDTSLITIAAILVLITIWTYRGYLATLFQHNPSVGTSTSYTLEGFVANETTDVRNSPRVQYEYDGVTPGEFPDTAYESAIRQTFSSYPALICNILPTAKSNTCMRDGVLITKYKYPVHVQRLINGRHIAVFNDGRLYMKARLIDTMWQGPLKNSRPKRTVPLRMVTTTPEGDRLVGVGFDGQAYIKPADDTVDVNIEDEWQPLDGLRDIIYLMYHYDEATNTNRFLVIDINGRIQITRTSESDSGLQTFGVLREPILKMCMGADGYMMAIDTQLRLRTFDSKAWYNSQLSTKFPPSQQHVLDVIYDNDQLLFGLVVLPKVSQVEVMKQEEAHITAPFVPLELNRYLDSSLDPRLTERTIINTKVGSSVAAAGTLAADVDEQLDNDVNMAYQRQMLADKVRLRQFCAKRGFGTKADNKNFELMREIDQNNEKIEQLNRAIVDLVSFDADKRQIQDAVIGVSYSGPSTSTSS